MKLYSSNAHAIIASNIAGEGVSDNLAHSSSSRRGNSSLELQSDNTNTHSDKEGQNTVSKDSPSHDGQKDPAAMCRCDVYRWEHGDYSLAGDEGDPGMGRFSLEALLHFCPQGTLAVLVLVFLTDLTGTKFFTMVYLQSPIPV